MNRAALLPAASLLCLASLLPLAGCHDRVSSGMQSQAAHEAQLSQDRQQLDQIPPPTKSRYMSVRSLESWENPYITVQPDMLSVHILFADANTSPVGAGGMLRPVGARRQEVNIRFDKLAEAMTAIPQGSWPYGRVVALEEAHQTPKEQERAVRQHMETAIATLNELGIMAYDMREGNLR